MRLLLSLLFSLSSFSVVEAQNLGPQDVENVAKTVEQSLAQGILKDIKEAVDSKSGNAEKIAAIEESLKTLRVPLSEFPSPEIRQPCALDGQILSHDSFGPILCYGGKWLGIRTFAVDE